MKARIVFVFLIILLRIFPYLVQRDIITNIGDNLDATIPSLVTLKHTNTTFKISNEQTIDLIGNDDFNRNFYVSGFNITSSLFYFLTPIYAFKINYLLSIFIGFFGMFLLIPLISKNISFVMRVLISISFTLIPWFHAYNCGYIAALPFFIFAILNLYNATNIKLSLFILFLYPFFNSFVLVGIFVLFYYVILLLVLLVLKKLPAFKLLLIGFGILFISTLVTEINLLNLMLNSTGYVSQRTARQAFELHINSVITQVISILKYGRTHAVSNHIYIVYFIIVSSIIYAIQTLYMKSKLVYWPFLLIAFIVLNTFIGEVSNSVLNISFLKGFDFSRFSMLNPGLYFVGFVLFLDLILSNNNKILKVVAFVFVLLNGINMISNNKEYTTNVRNCYNTIEYNDKISRENNLISFNSFYDTELFERSHRIMKGMDENPICVAFGFYPGILNFSGIHTLDHYTNNYCLDYKLRFRKVIEPEIMKSEYIRNKFDSYGSRCFLYSSELLESWHENRGEILTKFVPTVHIKKLEINIEALSKLNCNFILSTVVIDNYKDLNLDLVDTVTNQNSIYTIYIYKIENTAFAFTPPMVNENLWIQ